MHIRLFIFFVLLSSACHAISVKGELTRYYRASPGDTIEGKIVISNSSDKPASFAVAQRDYLFFASGESTYLQPGEVDRSNTGWFTDLRPTSAAIVANGEAELYFALKVPESLEDDGTYWSTLMIEPTKSPSDLEKEKAHMRISTSVRYAVQIIIDVGSTPAPVVTFRDPKIVNQDDRQVLRVDLANEGKWWFNPDARIEIYDQGGAKVLEKSFGKQRTFPGTQVRYELDASSLEPGMYEAIIILETAEDALAGVYKFYVE